MPTPKQMDKLAAEIGRGTPIEPGLAPDADLPPGYWQSLLQDAYAENQPAFFPAKQQLSQLAQNILRVGCRRCGRIVEIQKADAARLYGADALWRDVGQRLLDNTCTRRTGRYEEDGCWPSYETT